MYTDIFMYICGHLCINVNYKMAQEASAERGLTGADINLKWVVEIVRNITKEPSWSVAGGAESRFGLEEIWGVTELSWVLGLSQA